MILYLDASALVKLYVKETGSAEVRAAVKAHRGVCSHLIAYVEVRAGLAKARRMRRLDDERYQYQIQRFERDWKNLDAVLVDAAVVRRAGELADRFGLRAYDSVHLAAAERVFESMPPGHAFVFAAFDKRLCKGAKALGLDLLG